MSVLVSFVVPVYNVEAYLGACLDSILAQTAPDLEVVCVDDCSGDCSPKVLEGYTQKDPRVRVIRHDRNSGLSAARNTGMDAALGRWVVFVDSDDVVSRTLCERTLAAAARFDADVVFYGHVPFPDGETPPLDPEPVEPVVVGRPALLGRQAFAWTKLVSRRLLTDKAIRFPVGLCFEDVPVHWRLVLESAKPVLLDEAHIGYRQRSGSITYRTDWTRADGLRIYDLVATELRQSGNWDAYADHFVMAEMGNFASTYAYFELANPGFLGKVTEEARRRMTPRHVRVALSGGFRHPWQRSYILSQCCGPGEAGPLRWIHHRCLFSARSFARRLMRRLCGK